MKRENPVREEARWKQRIAGYKEEAMTEFEKKKKKEKKRNLAAIGEQMNALVRAIPSLSHRLYPRIPLSSLDIIHPGRE